MSTVIQDLYDQMADLPVGDWVAFSEDERRILAHGEDADAVMAEAKNNGEAHPLIARVLDPDQMMYF